MVWPLRNVSSRVDHARVARGLGGRARSAASAQAVPGHVSASGQTKTDALSTDQWYCYPRIKHILLKSFLSFFVVLAFERVNGFGSESDDICFVRPRIGACAKEDCFAINWPTARVSNGLKQIHHNHKAAIFPRLHDRVFVSF